MEKTLKITDKKAKELLGKVDWLDEILKNTFTPKELGLNIIDRIKTLSDALEYAGETLDQFNDRTINDTDDEKAYKELKAISFALNEGKHMDYSDTNVYKYYPYFNAAGSGSGFSFRGCFCVCAYSGVGARLCVDTREKAEYMGKQFISIYNRYINN